MCKRQESYSGVKPDFFFFFEQSIAVTIDSCAKVEASAMLGEEFLMRTFMVSASGTVAVISILHHYQTPETVQISTQKPDVIASKTFQYVVTDPCRRELHITCQYVNIGKSINMKSISED